MLIELGVADGADRKSPADDCTILENGGSLAIFTCGASGFHAPYWKIDKTLKPVMVRARLGVKSDGGRKIAGAFVISRELNTPPHRLGLTCTDIRWPMNTAATTA